MSNLTAFLSVIAACEGTGDRYDILYGGGTFTGDQHPNKAVTAGGYTSTAAGRYQILFSTWSGFRAAVHPAEPKFDPSGQDWCAQWLIDRRGALADVNAGRLEDAIAKCGKEWASLPGSPYGQPVRTLQFCLDAYTKAGGTLADRTEAPAPVEDQSSDSTINPDSTLNPNQPEATVADDAPSPFLTLLQGGAAVLTAVNPLIGSLASVLINAFAPLAKDKIATAINKHTDNPAIGQQVAQSLVQGAIDLTGKKDPVQATAAAQLDQAILKQLEQQTLDHIDKIMSALAPLSDIDKSVWAAEQAGRDAASARAKADPWDMTRALVLFAGCTSTFMVLAILSAILWQVVGQGKEPNTALMSLAGPLFMAALVCWKDIFAYRFDGTKDSAAKDVALANLGGKP